MSLLALTPFALKCFSPELRPLERPFPALASFVHGRESLTAQFVNKAWEHEKRKTPLTEIQIVEWAREALQNSGAVPKAGKLNGHPNEDWNYIDSALLYGWRGLPGGMTLDHVLFKHGLIADKPPLSEELIIINALKYFNQHHKLPGQGSGDVEGFLDETWEKWNRCSYRGNRGLEKGLGLHPLYVRYGLRLDGLTEKIILEHARRHHHFFGKLPTEYSGDVYDVPGENWHAWHLALAQGHRGLEGGLTLNRLFMKHDMVLGDLDDELLGKIIMKHLKRHNKFPNKNSGQVLDYLGETWSAFDQALVVGVRSQTGGSSLHKFIDDLICKQAAKHFSETGKIPTRASGWLPDYPSITWEIIDNALINRGSRYGTTLEALIKPFAEQMKDVISIQHANRAVERQRLRHWPIAAFVGPPYSPNSEP